MIPDPDTVFMLRLETNEMVERERFANLLAVIEQEIRNSDFAGQHAILVVGGVRQGSVEIILGIASLTVAVGSFAIAIPNFLISLKQMSRDKDRDPNSFAVAIGEVMALDGVNKAEFKHKDVAVSILREEVPFARSLQISPPRVEAASAINEVEQFEESMNEDSPVYVEDEDQDWLPTLEAKESPPRDANAAVNGYLNSLAMVGEFEKFEKSNGQISLRFVPGESTIAPFFEVTSNKYQQEPEESVEYNIIGNVSLDGTGEATLEILSISRSDDETLPLRT